MDWFEAAWNTTMIRWVDWKGKNSYFFRFVFKIMVFIVSGLGSILRLSIVKTQCTESRENSRYKEEIHLSFN